MKTLRALGLAFALLTPLAAFATPRISSSCMGMSACTPDCPFCPSGLQR